MTLIHPVRLDPAKFRHPDLTAKGERRASVPFRQLDTLWFNTGTLCNITCEHCYIESSPENDRLVYLTVEDVTAVLDEAVSLGQSPATVAFTGGEPFMNPDFGAIVGVVLERGHNTLVLTNAMRPMMRPRVRKWLAECAVRFPQRLSVRVSLDHFAPGVHDQERGPGSFAEALKGLRWLRDQKIRIAIAGRMRGAHDALPLREGYAHFFKSEGLAVDAFDSASLVLFPEMDASVDVPEITVDCWGILNQRPDDMMCASSRMVVRRKGSPKPAIVACTLLPYEPAFDFGPRLVGALGAVKLNHPHCAKFCVLGGGSCTV
jgi:uncharacterized Fe-S cluster-containing radical SAM superfamily protein